MAERLLAGGYLRGGILRQYVKLFRQGRRALSLVSSVAQGLLLPCHCPETPSTTLIRPAGPVSFTAVVCGTCTSSWSTNRNGMPASRSYSTFCSAGWSISQD